MFFDEIILESLGVGTAALVLIAVLIFSMIIAVKDYIIANFVASLLLFTSFVVFFQYDRSNVAGWGPLLIAWFVSMVILFLLLLVTYWGYEDKRKIIS